jgi:hypothetical protein
MNLTIGEAVVEGSSIDLKQTRDAFYFKDMSKGCILHTWGFTIIVLIN